MFYTRNLPAWERVTRVVGGIVMALCGLMAPGLAGTVGLMGFGRVLAVDSAGRIKARTTELR